MRSKCSSIKKRRHRCELCEHEKFYSIRSVVVKRLNIDLESKKGQFLQFIYHFILKICGNWSLETLKAIKEIKSLDKQIQNNSLWDRQETKIAIAGYENDSSLGQGSRVNYFSKSEESKSKSEERKKHSKEDPTLIFYKCTNSCHHTTACLKP